MHKEKCSCYTLCHCDFWAQYYYTLTPHSNAAGPQMRTHAACKNITWEGPMQHDFTSWGKGGGKFACIPLGYNGSLKHWASYHGNRSIHEMLRFPSTFHYSVNKHERLQETLQHLVYQISRKERSGSNNIKSISISIYYDINTAIIKKKYDYRLIKQVAVLFVW